MLKPMMYQHFVQFSRNKKKLVLFPTGIAWFYFAESLKVICRQTLPGFIYT